MTAAQLIEERNKLWHQAKAILDKAEGEKRTLTGEESQQYDRLAADIDGYGEQIATAERRERGEQIEAELRSRPERRTAPANPTHHRIVGRGADAFRTWLSRPARLPVSPDQAENARQCNIDLNDRSISLRLGRRPGDGEQRALSVGSNGTFATWDVGQQLERALLAYGNAKSLVRTIQTGTGNSFPIPTVDDTSNTAAIVSEAGAIPVNADPTTSSVTLGAFMYSTKAVKFSIQLAQDSMVDLDTLLPDLLMERLGRALNSHIVNGAGTTEPYGIFPRAGASGVTVAGTVASPTFAGNDFIDLLYSVDPAYRQAPGCGFMMHDTIVQRVRKLKDSNGQYLWQPSMQMGQPDRLLGYSLYGNQACPTLAAGAKIAAFGDYTKYTWREVSQFDLYRLDELFLMNGQLAIVGLYRGDGNLLNTGAVKTLLAPAS